MLEILALLSLSRMVEALAKKKGVKPYKWRLIMVGAWFGSEFTAAFIAYLVSGNILAAYAAAIICAIGSFFFVMYKLKQLPDKDDLLDTIGQPVTETSGA